MNERKEYNLKESEIRVKVCFKCHVYIPIYTNNEENIRKLKQFERDHSTHSLLTIPYLEIKERNFRSYLDR